MTNQMNVEKYRLNISAHLDDVAKMLTVIRNKRVKTKRVGNTDMVLERQMTPSDYISGLLHLSVEGVEPDESAKAWRDEQYKRNVELRKKADKAVREGAKRKPVEEHEKSGPKPGKPSEKFIKAMKELAEKRRMMTEQGISWRKGKNKPRKGNS